MDILIQGKRAEGITTTATAIKTLLEDAGFTVTMTDEVSTTACVNGAFLQVSPTTEALVELREWMKEPVDASN